MAEPKYCPQKFATCRPDCAWYVFYGRQKEKRLGQCVLLKLADLLEVHYLEMV